MIVFNPQKMDALLRRLSSGFGVKPLYIVIFFAIFGSIVAFFIVSWRIIHRREQRLVALRIEELNRTAEARLVLTEAEDAIVSRLARQLRDPRRRYLILSDERVFSTTLARARREGPIDSMVVAGVQAKLGIDPRDRIGRLSSTADLPPGLSVVLDSGGRRSKALVREQRADSMVLDTPKAASATIVPGAELRLYFHDRRGVFMFPVEVLQRDGTMVTVRHTDQVRKAQRRGYFRRTMHSDIVVRRGTDGPSQPAKLIDLGGGGASLTNPDGTFRRGDEITLYFTRGGDDWVPIGGRVVRTSKGDRVVHLEFARIDEATRDRIIRIAMGGT